MRLPIQIQVYVYRRVNEKIEYLLLKRIPAKGGNWQAVTGGLEEGETLKACVLRELAEETGIMENLVFIDNFYIFQFEENGFYSDLVEQTNADYFPLNEHKTVMTEYVFAVEVSSEEKVTLTNNIYPEHDEYKWCSFEEALESLKWENGKDALKKLKRILDTQNL